MKILVSYEETDVGGRTLDLAEQIVAKFGGTVYVVMSMVGGRDISQEVMTSVDETLAKIADRFAKKGIPCETRLLGRGLEPGDDVVKFAAENGIDQIIIGIKKKSKVGKLLFGSNAQHIILNAPCAVISVK